MLWLFLLERCSKLKICKRKISSRLQGPFSSSIGFQDPQKEEASTNTSELELIQFHMAQKPVLRGEVGCACVAQKAYIFEVQSKVYSTRPPISLGPYFAAKGKKISFVISLRKGQNFAEILSWIFPFLGGVGEI